jgi:hypothetical protein
MITVTPRARIRQEHAGDPLDGLVNMFDIGIVLAVAFLLAALSSLGLSDAVNDGGLTKPALGEVTIKSGHPPGTHADPHAGDDRDPVGPDPDTLTLTVSLRRP